MVERGSVVRVVEVHAFALADDWDVFVPCVQWEHPDAQEQRAVLREVRHVQRYVDHQVVRHEVRHA